MEKKYIRTSKYRKVSSENRKKRSENISRNLRKNNSEMSTSEVVDINKNKNSRKKEKKQKIYKKKKSKLTIVLLICVVILGVCAIRLTLKDENEPFFNIFGVKVEEEKIESLNVAVVDNVDVLDNNSKNVVLTELNNYTCGTLLKVMTNYEIEYELLESVEKEDNKTYILKISEDNSLTASVLSARLNSYMDKNSKYYEKCKNIQAIDEINSKSIKITLKEADAAYMYNLQLPISFSTVNTGIYNVSAARGASNKITYLKKDYIASGVPKSISVVTLKNDDEAIEMLKSGTIDMFFTDTYDMSEKLGKLEVDIRSYMNGKCLFLLGNKMSEEFSKKEVRQAIAYSIDREKIRKDIYLNSGTIIDIPEIYSDIKYKYDIYGAQNVLLASGYAINNAVFTKNSKALELTLLVQKTDETKVKVATYIKEDLENIGIKVNLKLLTATELEKQLKLNNYDLVLADISLNENPSISFIQEFINISDKTNEKMLEIDNAKSVQETTSKVKELINVMSDEIVCIGIHADSTYMVSKKGLSVFADIKYMNIFSDILLEEK